MSDLFLTGKIHKIGDIEEVTSTFTKRQFVVITDETYPQEVAFELIKDRCNIIDSYVKDQVVKVHFNVRGRSWTNPKTKVEKYFVSLNAWRIEDMQQIAPAAPFPTEEPGNDLPF